jgi:hypothetical protein
VTWSARLLPIAAILASVCTTPAAAQQPAGSARLATARRVLEASGATEMMIAAIRANLPAQRAAASPQIPAEFWTRFERAITERAPEFVDSVAALYAQRLTQEELDDLLRFYQSPIGRRMRELQPALLTESSAIGQRWGMRIGAEIGASLQRQN